MQSYRLAFAVSVALVVSAGCAGGSGAGDEGVAAMLKPGDPGPGGGTVILVDPAGFPCGEELSDVCTYLEVAPVAAQVERRWSAADEALVGVTFQPRGPSTDGVHAGIGAGEYNSRMIAESPGSGDAATNAAIYSLEYRTDTADDWYLPSIDELQVVYDNAALVDGVVMTDSYWSSTEGSAIDAWGIYFASGLVSTNFKWRDQTYHARPVRAG